MFSSSSSFHWLGCRVQPRGWESVRLRWGWCDREINATVVKEREREKGATHRVSLWRCCSTFVHVSRLYIYIYCIYTRIVYVYKYIHALCTLFVARPFCALLTSFILSPFSFFQNFTLLYCCILFCPWCFCCVSLWSIDGNLQSGILSLFSFNRNRVHIRRDKRGAVYTDVHIVLIYIYIYIYMYVYTYIQNKV